MTETKITGSCLCGRVAFEAELPSLFVVHCHCTMCRRAHGAGYVTWIAVREDGFRITAGADDVVDFQSSEHTTRSFCKSCGASMFCNDQRHENVIDLTLANLHGPADQPPGGHYYFDTHAPWAPIDDALPKFGGTTDTDPL